MDIWGWMGNLVQNYGYAGAFLISIFGNFTIFFPVPFTITIYAFGATLNPFLLGLVCGVGSTIGEFSAYLVGRGGRKVIEGRYEKRFESAKLLIQRYGMAIIFIFALLPLPDDLILIPLGVLRYDLKKAMTAAFLGKFAMCTIVAYAGLFSYTIVRDLFESGGMIGGIASVILLVVILVAMMRIDWTKFIEPKKSEDEE
ncbi:MAG: VTT domain-containing protein [Candidatus Bathyarchaeota archaeon]|nr:MAG: VTT domain-containing protein [Candidatus Bathyarchaeota archaeon]